MKNLMMLLLLLLIAGTSLYAETETFHYYGTTGMEEAFSWFKFIDFTNNQEVVFRVRGDEDKPMSTNFYKKVSHYPVSLYSDVGQPITNFIFTLKRGETVCWGRPDKYADRYVLAYISGGDIPKEVKCPDAYRKATDVFHLSHHHRYGWDYNILFDPNRKKQFSLIYPHEYDYPFFPYRERIRERYNEQNEARQNVRLSEIVCEKVKDYIFPESLKGVVVLSLPCDYRVDKFYDRIFNNGVVSVDGFDENDEILFRSIDSYKFTNLLVAVSKQTGRWQATGFWAQGSKARNCVESTERFCLIDENGKIRRLDTGNEQDIAVLRKMYADWDRKFEEMRLAAFDWSGPFTIERLYERVAADAERIRIAQKMDAENSLEK